MGVSVVVRVQMLSELEEIISYKDHMDEPERQATLRRTWQRRSALITGGSRSHLLSYLQARRMSARCRSLAAGPASSLSRLNT